LGPTKRNDFASPVGYVRVPGSETTLVKLSRICVIWKSALVDGMV